MCTAVKIFGLEMLCLIIVVSVEADYESKYEYLYIAVFRENIR